MIRPLLFAGFLEEVLIRDAWNIAFVYVAVKRISRNGPFVFQFQTADNLVRRFAGPYPVRYGLSVFVIIAQLDGTALDSGLPFGISLGDIGGVAFDVSPGSAVQVVIQTTLYFTMEGGYGKACFPGKGSVGRTGVKVLFYGKPVCPGHVTEPLCHAVTSFCR